MTSALQTEAITVSFAGTIPGDESALDLLPAAGLVTSSEDYYPTVAINALMRVLRDPGLASLHSKAVQSLFDIVRAMRLNFVPYLPKASGRAWHAVPCGGAGMCENACMGCMSGSNGRRRGSLLLECGG